VITYRQGKGCLTLPNVGVSELFYALYRLVYSAERIGVRGFGRTYDYDYTVLGPIDKLNGLSDDFNALGGFVGVSAGDRKIYCHLTAPDYEAQFPSDFNGC